MNERPTDKAFDELESALESAVQAVLAEPLPDEALERVKARAKRLDDPVASRRLPGGTGKRRWARYSSLAVALAILVTVAFWLLTTPSTGRAFADVIESVQQATSLEVTATMRWEKGTPGDSYKMYLEESRLRMEHDNGLVIIVPNVNERIALFFHVPRKLYQLSDLSEEMTVQIASPIDHFRRATPDDAEHIGEEQVDGRLAALYRVRNPDFMGIQRRGEMLIWVDPTNSLPVRIVIRSGKSEQRFEDFRWNQDMDDRLFSLEPPEDYVEGQVVGFPAPKVGNEPARPVSPSQLAKGILSDDRIPFRMVWGPQGSTITATTHIQAHCELRQWDVDSGEVRWTKHGDPDSLAWTADGKTLATVRNRSHEVEIRTPSTGKVIRTWTTDKRLGPLAFSPDGKRLAAGVSELKPAEGGVRIWDVETGKLEHSWSEEDATYLVRYSPDGKYVAASSPNVKIRDARTCELVRVLPTGNQFDFSPDGKHIACRADKQYQVRIYEWRTGATLKTLVRADTTADPIVWIDYSPDGRLIAGASWNGAVTLWEAATGDVVKTITEHDGGVLFAVFSPDGKMLATGSEDKTLRLWNVEELRVK